MRTFPIYHLMRNNFCIIYNLLKRALFRPGFPFRPVKLMGPNQSPQMCNRNGGWNVGRLLQVKSDRLRCVGGRTVYYSLPVELFALFFHFLRIFYFEKYTSAKAQSEIGLYVEKKWVKPTPRRMQLRKVCTHVYQTRVSTVNAILTNFEWKWMEINHENMM